MRKFSAEQGIASIEMVMLSHQSNIIVADIIQGQLFLYNSGSLLKQLNFENKAQSKDEYANRIKGILQVEESQRSESIQEFLEFTIRDIIKVAHSEKLDYNQDIKEMGIDSLMEMELRTHIQALLSASNEQTQLSLQSLQENRTINKLTKLIAAKINN